MGYVEKNLSEKRYEYALGKFYINVAIFLCKYKRKINDNVVFCDGRCIGQQVIHRGKKIFRSRKDMTWEKKHASFNAPKNEEEKTDGDEGIRVSEKVHHLMVKKFPQSTSILPKYPT
ncbi:hypothetical protein HHI36_018505 [Cryptolaemus montrouzieri]|uniref:Uncharacterized protein n=1 Tax=Cryptolaemus montrouzieri TaxID=559131 RepID=A0ABD2P047_9CUCU